MDEEAEKEEEEAEVLSCDSTSGLFIGLRRGNVEMPISQMPPSFRA